MTTQLTEHPLLTGNWQGSIYMLPKSCCFPFGLIKTKKSLRTSYRYIRYLGFSLYQLEQVSSNINLTYRRLRSCVSGKEFGYIHRNVNNHRLINILSVNTGFARKQGELPAGGSLARTLLGEMAR